MTELARLVDLRRNAPGVSVRRRPNVPCPISDNILPLAGIELW